HIPNFPAFPTRRSSDLINFRGSVRYGLGVLATTTEFALQKLGLAHFGIFNPSGRKLPIAYYAAAAGQPVRERAAESTAFKVGNRSEEHTSELQSHLNLV